MKWRAICYVTVATLGVTLALGQKRSRNTPKYDAANEVTIKGVVEEVKEFQCPISGALDGHITVKMDDGKTFLAHLASPKFLKEYDISFAKGDRVEVLGAKAKVGEQEDILARKIERGNQNFLFRDKDGKPLW
jgi:DNA/RNA endonuclease YhcR with UshA esterase domain